MVPIFRSGLLNDNDTIVLGSIIPSIEKDFFFVIEDISTFRGKIIIENPFGEKLVYLQQLLHLYNKIDDILSFQLTLPVFWEYNEQIPFPTILHINQHKVDYNVRSNVTMTKVENILLF